MHTHFNITVTSKHACNIHMYIILTRMSVLNAHTVQLISKLTLACGNTRVFLYFCPVTQTELACDMRVIFHVEHASSISCAAQDPPLCAARL